jgi:hypothetical protein
VRCTFTETFSETFTLDAGAAAFFGIPDAYIGTDVTITGLVDGVVWIIVPGKK